MPSAVTSAGVPISANSAASSRMPTHRDDGAEHELKTSESPARCAPLRAARRSPCRRAATAVSPTPIISASEMIIQIQNSDVETAARPAAPIFVPTQNASTEENSVISSDDATAGQRDAHDRSRGANR